MKVNKLRLFYFGVLFILVSVVLGIHLAARLGNRTQLKRAVVILDGADKLRMNQSDLNEVLQYTRAFGGEERSSRPEGACTPSDCLTTVYALPSDFNSKHEWLIRLNGWMGVHPFHLHVTLWVKDGKLVATNQTFFVPTEHSASVFVSSSRRLPFAELCKNPSYRLHRDYTTSLRLVEGAPFFEYWTSAVQSPRMDLSCTTSWKGCTSVVQVMPEQWKQYEEDKRQLKVYEGTPETVCPR